MASYRSSRVTVGCEAMWVQAPANEVTPGSLFSRYERGAQADVRSWAT